MGLKALYRKAFRVSINSLAYNIPVLAQSPVMRLLIFIGASNTPLNIDGVSWQPMNMGRFELSNITKMLLSSLWKKFMALLCN